MFISLASRTLELAPLALIAAIFLAVNVSEARLPSINHGTADQRAGIAAGDEQEELMRSQAVSEAGVGLECWDPSTGQVGTHLVVEWATTGDIELIPFTDNAYAQATAGAFWTLRTCWAGAR